MAAVSYAISQIKNGGNTIIAFDGHQYNQFLHNFAAGKLFIRRNSIDASSVKNEQHNDILALLDSNSILINSGTHIIEKKCRNASISFRLDNMLMSEDNIHNISECLVSNMTAYSSVDIAFKDDKFVKRNSYNIIFIIETNACVKKIPLLISIQYELDE